jgi:YebC/PmpR family DNA-binding regulatory protein
MSGHSKWSQIKHQKGTNDAKRGQIFSKLAKFITIAAKKGSDQKSNPTLREAINKAKASNMPSGNIERAIKKALGGDGDTALEEVRYELFAPGGAALIIEGITDNKNRTSNEIKHLLSQHEAKLADPGSVIWAFEKKQDGGWTPKTTIQISENDKNKLDNLIKTLQEHEDIQNIYNNAQ